MTTTPEIYVPDIERAACQILADDAHLITHPVLRAYVEALLINPAFADRFDAGAGSAWTPSAEVVVYANGEGFPLPGRGKWGEQFATSWGPNYYGDTDADQLKRDRDIMIGQFAYAIGAYRRDGRPDGDQTQALHGIGGPVALVTSSLAAAVADYHRALTSHYADELAILRRRLRRLSPQVNSDEDDE